MRARRRLAIGDAERLGDWHMALQQLNLPFADCAPLNWLENGHD